MRRMAAVLGVTVGLGLMVHPAAGGIPATGTSPPSIPLPNGFRPEGIGFGKGSTFFVGSLANGAVFRANASTGRGDVFVPSGSRPQALGLEFDSRRNRLFVAAGPSGGALVYDATSGQELTAVQFTSERSIVNDVALTSDAAWFTDSARPVLYRVSRADPIRFEEVPLGGEFVFDPSGTSANGIVAMRGGKSLVIVHSQRGELYRVDPKTGSAKRIDLGGATVTNGDGLVARDRDVYVVQNRDNKISLVRLNRALDKGEVRRTITNERFRVPSTAALYRGDLYVVNARFGTPFGPDVDYDVVRVKS